MVYLLLVFIFIRPFIASLAYPLLNLLYSYLFIAFLLIWLIKNRRGLFKQARMTVPVLCFSAAILVSGFFAVDKPAFLRQLDMYCLNILAMLTASSLSMPDKKRVIAALIWGALLISLLAIYQYIFGFRHLLSYLSRQHIQNEFAWDYISKRRAFLPFVTPNMLGGYLAYMLPLSFMLKEGFIIAAFISLAIILTKSIGAMVAVLAGGIVYLYLAKKAKLRYIFVLLLPVAILSAIFIGRSLDTKPHLHPVFSISMRADYWRQTIQIMRKHPLTGIGIGNFNLPDSRYAHNLYLQLWAECGILGIIAFLWLVIAGFIEGLKGYKTQDNGMPLLLLLISIVIFLAHNLVDFTFFLPETSTSWWIILGMIFSCG